MKVGLHDADATKFPNLALMKLSAAYKQAGHTVELFDCSQNYDKVISAKVFTYTQADKDLPDTAILGGYGYGKSAQLPEDVEHICPDYELYGVEYSLGFLTRGCIRKCSHCFVWRREGGIRKHADFSEFVIHKNAVFMDNNVLAHQHGLDQITKLANTGVKVDFNQGLDARLIDPTVAIMLSKLKWLHPIRLACDSSAQMKDIEKAVNLLRWHNATPSQYFCYVLIKDDVDEALERIKFLKGLYVYPFAQPYMDEAGTKATIRQRQLARWCNHRALFRSITFEEYEKSRGPERV